jgi:hypothetical protein
MRTLKYLIILTLATSSCSHYKSSWDCKNPQGIGCSSIEYADDVARKRIILNEIKNEKSKSVLIREHYADFKKYKTQKVEID